MKLKTFFEVTMRITLKMNMQINMTIAMIMPIKIHLEVGMKMKIKIKMNRYSICYRFVRPTFSGNTLRLEV